MTQDAIANDEELAEAMVKASGGQLPESKATKNPPLRYWTQTDSLLATLIMEIRQQSALLIRINSKKDSAAPKVTPVPVPETAFQRIAERIQLERRLSKHQTLVRRLLGDRANRK